MFNAKEQKDKVVQWIRDWFEKNGNESTAIIGISGGKDSTVTAALCVAALGCDSVYGVLMPSNYQPDLKDSVSVCKALGINFDIFDIGDAVEKIEDIVSGSFFITNQAKINLPARIRMTTLYCISQCLNGRVANTCNLSEDYIGYSTKYGDAAGDFAPLKSFTTEEVIAIGRELGIPEKFLVKAPSDGLCGKTDEDNLGFTYAVLNKYIRTGKIEDKEIKKKIDHLHGINSFKEKVIERYEYKGD